MDAALEDAYVRDGYVVVRGAVPLAVASACADLLWEETGYDRDDPGSWVEPVRWVPYMADPPFAAAATAPAVVDALDALIGPGRWVPRTVLGSFPLRFPHASEPDDAGWHIEASFRPDDADPGSDQDHLGWRVNASSRGRAALLLFLFSDVGQEDAPTRVRVGSHLDVPPVLAPFGARGASVPDVAGAIEEASRHRPTVLATGAPGDVFVCHPFLVHAAQPHHGTRPRFMAQPGIEPLVPLELTGPLEQLRPVGRAIRLGLDAVGG